MTGKEWLYIVIVLAIAAGVGVPLLGDILRARNFKAQVEGRKPIRVYDEKRDHIVTGQDPGRQSLEMESLKTIAEMKSKQNSFGPK